MKKLPPPGSIAGKFGWELVLRSHGHDEVVPIGSFRGAVKECRRWISKHKIKEKNWIGAAVRAGRGQIVGVILKSGDVLLPDGRTYKIS